MASALSSAAMTIAIVTSDVDWVRADKEDMLLIAALGDIDVASVRIAWDTRVDWSSFTAVVISTTWDYHHRASEFLQWIDLASQATTMWNPPEMIRWNANKRYLIQMSEAGLAVIPTAAAGTVIGVGEAADVWGADDVVIKPVVSASARGTAKFRATDVVGVGDHLAALSEPMIVQPFQPSVETDGETSLVYFDGVYSHAVRKNPKPGDFRTQTHLGGTLAPTQPRSAQLTAAEEAIAFIDQLPLYVRVDLIEGDEGPLLIELELIEPSLFLTVCEGSAERFAAAIATRLPE